MLFNWLNRLNVQRNKNKNNQKSQKSKCNFSAFEKVATYYHGFNVDSILFKAGIGFNTNPYVISFFEKGAKYFDVEEWKEKFKEEDAKIQEFGRFLQAYVIVNNGIPEEWQESLRKYEHENIFYTLLMLIDPNSVVEKKIEALNHNEFAVRFVAAVILATSDQSLGEKSSVGLEIEKRVLQVLSEGDESLKFFIAPSIKPEFKGVMKAFAADKSEKVRLAFGTNSFVMELEGLIEQVKKDEFLARGVASNHSVSVSVLQEIFMYYQDRNIDVLKSLARNPKTPVEILKQLMLKSELWSDLSENTELPTEILSELVEFYWQDRGSDLIYEGEGNAEMLERIAKRKNCPAGILRKLAEHPRASVRLAVAESTECPSDLDFDRAELQKQVEKEKKLINMVLESKFDIGFSDKGKEAVSDNYIECELAEMDSLSNVPESRLRELIQSSDVNIRKNVACNPACPSSILFELTSDSNESVRKLLARHPNLSIEAMEKLSKDKSDEVRWALVHRPGLPEDIYRSLEDFRNYYVNKLNRAKE